MRRARELSLTVLAAALAAAAATGCGTLDDTTRREGQRAAPALAVAPGRPAARTRRRSPARVARPARLLIPSIGVAEPLETLGLLADGRLEVPHDPYRPGWWKGGPRPGSRGAAVVAGHVDSRTGPAVFARLRELRPGDRIVVEDRAGRAVRFTVRASEEHPKDRFPTQRVYGGTRRPTLRLITCSGTFDRSAGHYDSNLVVFADLASAPRPRSPSS